MAATRVFPSCLAVLFLAPELPKCQSCFSMPKALEPEKP